MRRHFTATGFIVQGDRTLLHWHQRLQQWMPPGGHIEPDEDPVAAVLREIKEETGLAAAVIAGAPLLAFPYPDQIPAPYIILLEDSPEPGEPHQHVDLIYFCRPVDGASGGPPAGSTFRWVDEATLGSQQPLELPGCGVAAPPAEDVRQLALIAIEAGRRADGPQP